MQQSNSFFVKQLIWSYLLFCVGLITVCFVSSLSIYRNCILSFILYAPFPILLVLSTKFIMDCVMRVSKNGVKKKWVIVISIFLYIFKYILAILPLLIGVLINTHADINIFNLISLVVVVLIYPTSSLLSQFNFMKENK